MFVGVLLSAMKFREHQMSKHAPLDFATMHLSEISEQLAANTISSVDLVEFYLARISRLNPKLNAFALVFEEAAKEAAVRADAERRAGRVKGPLHGIPVAVKDIFHVTGYPTRAGSLAYSIGEEQDSATVVSRLEDAGMILIGKTQTVEFAYGGLGLNDNTGTPWNPWDLDTHRVPGGSSSGSAVAVAAGLVPAALGSDTGGSCRTPAAFCGCVGVKPSFGLLGRTGSVPFSSSFDTPGVMTRSAKDAALLLDVLIGADPNDQETQNQPPVSPLEQIEEGVGGLRFGRLTGKDLDGIDQEVLFHYEQALAELKVLGAAVVDFQFPHSLAHYQQNTLQIFNAEIGKNFGHLAEQAGSKVQPYIQDAMRAGLATPADELAELLDGRIIAQDEMSAAIDRIDAVITPTCAVPAIPLADIHSGTAATPFTRIANYLNMAALTVPCGLTKSGLPVGLHIIVRRYDDSLLLRIGEAYGAVGRKLVTSPPGLD